MNDCLAFLDQWNTDPNSVKPTFLHFKELLEKCSGTCLSFKSRPGISYSLRCACPESDRDLFVMVDVVDDDPEDRWLSVCFFDDQVSDPEDLGDWAPEGLAGKDARCFNIEGVDQDMIAYTEARIQEAFTAAKA